MRIVCAFLTLEINDNVGNSLNKREILLVDEIIINRWNQNCLTTTI